MTTQALDTQRDTNDILDDGKRLFITGIYLPLTVGLVLFIVSIGWVCHPLAVVYAILTCVVLLWLAEALYGGKRTA